MKIVKGKDFTKYYDVNGKELHAGDIAIVNGRKQKLYETSEGLLGTDATNPSWISSGRAFECSFGIYPLGYYDEVELVQSVN